MNDAVAPRAALRARGVLTVLMLGVAVTAPMNGVRAPGGPAVCDILLVISAVLVLSESVRCAPPADAGPRALPAAFWGGVALVVFGGVLGTFFAADPLASLDNLLQFASAVVLPLLVLRRWQPDLVMLRRYAWCWVGGAVTSAVVALASRGDASGRSRGLTTHPNHLAMISVLGVGLALGLTAWERGWLRGAAACSSALLALAVVRSGSRAGLVALAVTGGVFVLRANWTRPRATQPDWRALRFGGIVIAVLALLASSAVMLGRHNAVRRALGDATSATSDQGRVHLLYSGIHSIEARPLTGSGFENALRAHDIYIQIWAAAGLLGIVGFLLLASTTVKAGLSVARASPRRWLACALVAGYTGYLLAGTVQNFLWDRYLWLHVAMIVWLSVAEKQDSAAEEPCG